MSPDELLLRRLAREIEVELTNIERLRSELRDAPRGSDTFSLRSRASVLHDFYTGVERIFVRVADAFLSESRAFAGWLRGEE